MRLLLFSDLHSDFRTASKLVDLSKEVDIVVGAGDFCVGRRGLEKIIKALAGITKPAVLVPGNSESKAELIDACRGWKRARVLHGSRATIEDITFFGLGGGIPVTPFGSWSCDFSEGEAAELLRDCPPGCILISHSPPEGVLDLSSAGRRLGSLAVKKTIEDKKPTLVVCGHIHASAGQSSRLGKTTVINAGPEGMIYHYGDNNSN